MARMYVSYNIIIYCRESDHLVSMYPQKPALIKCSTSQLMPISN